MADLRSKKEVKVAGGKEGGQGVAAGDLKLLNTVGSQWRVWRRGERGLDSDF